MKCSAHDEPNHFLGQPDRIVYIPSCGIQFEIFYRDRALDGPDNDFKLWCQINQSTLEEIAGRLINNEADAKRVMLSNRGKVRAAVARHIENRTPNIGGGARIISANEFIGTKRRTH